MSWRRWRDDPQRGHPDAQPMKPSLVIHVPRHMLSTDGAALAGLYQKLRKGFQARGLPVELCWRDLDALGAMQDTAHIHLVHNGRIRHARVLNTGLAYVFPFWYCDPKGVFADSSLTETAFDPNAIDPQAAGQFVDQLTRRLVGQRMSRYDQPADRRHFPTGSIAVFLQGISDPVERARHMSEAEMFEAVLAARGARTLILKPHPRNLTGDTATILARAKKLNNVIITDANVHDILAASAVTVSISSSTALEGMLHRAPAVLCGRSDLHHCAETAQCPADITGAIERALERAFPYTAFLYWFLEQHMLNTGRDDLIDRVIAKFRAQGVALDAPGPGN